jgi:hypothetical protein
MAKQKQALLPIEELYQLFSEAVPEEFSEEPTVRATVINFSEFKKTRTALVTGKEEADDVYEYARKFTSHYKIFG